MNTASAPSKQGGKPALTDLYLSAMDTIHAVASGVLFLLEGAGQQGLGANWGDGFCCDPALIRRHDLSDPNPLFRAILKKPYRNQVPDTPLLILVHIFSRTLTVSCLLPPHLFVSHFRTLSNYSGNVETNVALKSA